MRNSIHHLRPPLLHRTALVRRLGGNWASGAFALVVLALVSVAGPARAQFGLGGGGGEVTAELLSEVKTIAPGETFTVGLQLNHQPGWHTYWRNAGVAGIPTKLTWDLPVGFSAGEIQWPVPDVSELFGLISFSYGDTVLLVVDITAPDNLETGQKLSLKTVADWQQCKEACVLVNKALSVDVTVGERPVPDPSVAAAFEAARKRLPVESDAWSVSAEVDESSHTIAVSLTPKSPDAAVLEPGHVYFFPDSGEQVVYEKSQQIAAAGGEGHYTLTLKLDEGGDASPARLRGVIANESGWTKSGQPVGIPVSIVLDDSGALTEIPAPDPFDELVPPASGDVGTVTPDQQKLIDEIRSWGVVGLDGAAERPTGLWKMILFALLGGIILNIMPCVFPVLSIKIMGFVQQSGDDSKKIKLHGLVFAAGVIASMWVLVAVLLWIKSAVGESVSWGYQLQQPAFVSAMIVVFVLLGLSLSGVFEIGLSMTSVGGNLQGKSGYLGSFFSGLLTVLVATPCTGPFMGPAVAFALGGSPARNFIIFTALAIGVALPYVLLSFFPPLIKRLPRPGPWMETFKQFMAFPLYATAIWFIGVLGKNIGLPGLMWFLFGLLALAMGAWAYGRYSTPVRKPAVRWAGRATAAASVAALVWMTANGISQKQAPHFASGDTVERFGMKWEIFSLDRLVEHRKKGRTVFIDFTADW